MSALGHKRTFAVQKGGATWDVRFVPTADILLDHFVRASDQRVGDVDAERFRCFEINNQLDLGDLLDGQIGRLLALEDAARVDAGLFVRLSNIAHRNSAARRSWRTRAPCGLPALRAWLPGWQAVVRDC